jgi:hypothetical protein
MPDAILLTAEDLASHNMAVQIHAVDEDGIYAGLVPSGEPGYTQVEGPPPSAGFHRVGAAWVRTLVLADEKKRALDAIDVKAGQVRLRFITDVPGQQATYIRKAEQARAYAAAGYTGTLPPYIAAEAAATGLTAAQCSDTIIGLSDLWEGTIGPAIEQVRIGGKQAVTAAADIEAVNTALATALGTLEAITP